MDKEIKDFNEKDFEIFIKKVAQNIQKKRTELNKTQADIAYNALGFDSISYYNHLENCTNNKHFNLRHLYAISKFLDCDISEFFKGI